MFRKSYFFLLIALLLTAVLIVYQQLGGFKDPEISYLDIYEYHIAGIYYEGKITSGKWESLFFQTRDLIESNRLPGMLTIVWYNEPEREKGFARAFIGVKFDGVQDIPTGFEVRTIHMEGVIRATMDSHITVMPNPQKVTGKIKAWATERQYELQGILIEVYPKESAIYSEIPVRQKKSGS
jgi:predicted transcriptional regulator YdeE